MPIAMTRPVSASLQQCELTHLARQPIDLERARAQHRQYELCLESLGYEIRQVPEAPELPDAVFIEDIALVLDEVAVITRPGAESRRPEIPAVAQALATYRPLLTIQAPGTLDGGDVLRTGKTLYVGSSGRSNPQGIAQLGQLLAPFGYNVQPVPVTGCLHLKSAITQVAEDLLLVNPDWINLQAFAGMGRIEVDPSEPYAANALLLNGIVLYPAAHPATRARLEAAGIRLQLVDASELAKAEGGVTCCSLIFEA